MTIPNAPKKTGAFQAPSFSSSHLERCPLKLWLIRAEPDMNETGLNYGNEFKRVEANL